MPAFCHARPRRARGRPMILNTVRNRRHRLLAEALCRGLAVAIAVTLFPLAIAAAIGAAAYEKGRGRV